jgi:pyridoxamine 5'-phosphate oxidase
MTKSLDPIATLVAWCDEASRLGVAEPTSMVLATATVTGVPSARIVLFRGLTRDGALRFFTNYESRKAMELDANPRAAGVFYWRELGRQVRVEGSVARLPAPDSDAYFAGRARMSQLGAWASPQSQHIASLDELVARRDERAREFEGGPVPRPPFWGGYAFSAARVELWINGDARFHGRQLFEREGVTWRVSTLAP